MKQQRLKPEARKEDILKAAVVIAADRGYKEVTREEIADQAGVSGPVLNYHFGTMTQFRRELMRYAIRTECLRVIAQGIVSHDKQTAKIPPDLRQKALDSLS